MRKNMNPAADEMLESYEWFLREEERGQATAEKYLQDMRELWGYVKAAGEGTFNEVVVLEYKQYLGGRYKTTGVNSMLAAINSYFDYLGCDECRVKLFKIQRTQFNGKRRELTEKDCE